MVDLISPSNTKIAGFDLRASPRQWVKDYWTDAMRTTHLLRRDAMLPLSLDQMVWPRSEREDVVANFFYGSDGPPDTVAAYTNGLDLFVAIPRRSKIVARSSGSGKGLPWLIAATIAAEVAERDADRLGPYPATEITVPILDFGGWVLLGFDVVDLLRGVSGLLNCGIPSSAEGPTLRSEFLSSINEYSLFSSEEVANIFAVRCNALLPSHAPFEPVGLWSHTSNV